MVLGEARLAILLAVLFTFPAALPAGAVAPPATVVALVAADATLVYWLPAHDEVEDATYNVYGEVDGALFLLESTKATAAVILGKYDRFAVTTVVGADESDPAYAVGGICVRPSQVPPVDTDCAAMGVEA